MKIKFRLVGTHCHSHGDEKSWILMQEKIYRFEEFEGFRAVLAWWVVCAHIMASLHLVSDNLLWPLNIIRNGSIAVNGFMILSGFVITHLIFAKRENFKVFIVRRYLRLAPVFLVTNIMALALFLWFGFRDPVSNYENWIRQLIINMSLLHGLIPDELIVNGSRSLVPPGWSISLEWQFYLAVPFFFWAFTQVNRAKYFLLVMFAILVFGAFYNRRTLGLTFPHASVLIFGIQYFLIGILSYCAWMNMQVKKRVNLPLALIISLVVFVFTKDYALVIWSVVFLGVTIGALKNHFFAWILQNRLMKWLGKISYSIYLSHFTVVFGILYVLKDVFLIEGWLLSVLMFSVVPLVVVGLSSVLYKFVELPAINFGKKLFLNDHQIMAAN